MVAVRADAAEDQAGCALGGTRHVEVEAAQRSRLVIADVEAITALPTVGAERRGVDLEGPIAQVGGETDVRRLGGIGDEARRRNVFGPPAFGSALGEVLAGRRGAFRLP